MPRTELTGLWSCPNCNLAFSPTGAVIALGYCPRCVAHRHVKEAGRENMDAEITRQLDLIRTAQRGTVLPVQPNLRARVPSP